MSALDYLQSTTQNLTASLQAADTPEDWMVANPTIGEAARFGALDTSLILAGALVGAALDPHLAKVTKAKGYGPILGAVVANMLGATIAAGAQGWRPAVGVGLGSGAALLPAGIAMALGRDATGKTAQILLGASALIVGASYVRRVRA